MNTPTHHPRACQNGDDCDAGHCTRCEGYMLVWYGAGRMCTACGDELDIAAEEAAAQRRALDAHVVKLPSGRTIAFSNFDYVREYSGSRSCPPEPAEVSLDSGAYWVDGDTLHELTPAELDALHDSDDPGYLAILTHVESLQVRT